MLPFITEFDVLHFLQKGKATIKQLQAEFHVSLDEEKPVSVSHKEWHSRIRQLTTALSRLSNARKIYYDRSESRGAWKIK
jgi:uncharacterized protein YktB (UPF0637 family)